MPGLVRDDVERAAEEDRVHRGGRRRVEEEELQRLLVAAVERVLRHAGAWEDLERLRVPVPCSTATGRASGCGSARTSSAPDGRPRTCARRRSLRRRPSGRRSGRRRRSARRAGVPWIRMRESFGPVKTRLGRNALRIPISPTEGSCFQSRTRAPLLGGGRSGRLLRDRGRGGHDRRQRAGLRSLAGEVVGVLLRRLRHEADGQRATRRLQIGAGHGTSFVGATAAEHSREGSPNDADTARPKGQREAA